MQSVQLAVLLAASKHIAPLGAVHCGNMGSSGLAWGISLMLEGAAGTQVCSPDSCTRLESGLVLGL